MSRFRPLLAALLLVPTLALAAKDLRETEPVAIPAKLSQAQAIRAVKQAALVDNWVITSAGTGGPGNLVAAINVRDKHKVKVAVIVGRSDIRISYLDSENMDYEVEKDGVKQIHGSYMKWTHRFGENIQRKLQETAIE